MERVRETDKDAELDRFEKVEFWGNESVLCLVKVIGVRMRKRKSRNIVSEEKTRGEN